MSSELLVGTARIDITPAVGTALAGSLTPRTSIGVQDPLYIKAVVLESGGVTLAYVLLDLIKLFRVQGDEAVRLASQKTGTTHVSQVSERCSARRMAVMIL